MGWGGVLYFGNGYYVVFFLLGVYMYGLYGVGFYGLYGFFYGVFGFYFRLGIFGSLKENF